MKFVSQQFHSSLMGRQFNNRIYIPSLMPLGAGLHVSAMKDIIRISWLSYHACVFQSSDSIIYLLAQRGRTESGGGSPTKHPFNFREGNGLFLQH